MASEVVGSQIEMRTKYSMVQIKQVPEMVV